ncbi:sigma-70 family RNA polymerase sigma factor [Aurantimonas endophytica]|uniref:RNA polymerase sigma factor n=1 Tax=Aurantimonas endophytica TaxID=1522175 RepID=A0A7W6HF61_9HYPH|nr:sigma-70 family RNA polymerase sigma factor [Aurantimonas endophytica]MBB4004120.1 RNA polymerase sigma-70 factor (ECF subfamily) [Aurantimonas endophytica]MCO6404964.1 sigma-70 family RNA polymerase sigma factor [Aurantimonas endophytica]
MGFDHAAAILACARGRHEALKALYDEDAARLLGIAMRILRRRDVAEDVVQEVFISVWRKADSFDAGRGNGRAWLSRITRNAALNRLRAMRPTAELDEARLDEVPDDADDPHAALSRLEDASLLKACLERLDEAKRRAILLAYVDGCSQTEIAERMAMPHNTVKSWIRRGLLLLRECLQ